MAPEGDFVSRYRDRVVDGVDDIDREDQSVGLGVDYGYDAVLCIKFLRY